MPGVNACLCLVMRECKPNLSIAKMKSYLIFFFFFFFTFFSAEPKCDCCRRASSDETCSQNDRCLRQGKKSMCYARICKFRDSIRITKGCHHCYGRPSGSMWCIGNGRRCYHCCNDWSRCNAYTNQLRLLQGK